MQKGSPKERTIFDVPTLVNDIHHLQDQVQQGNYSHDLKEQLRELKRKQHTLDTWMSLERSVSDLRELEKLPDEEKIVLADDIEKQIHALDTTLRQAEATLFLSGPYDDHDGLLEIHVGNGGNDAEDFVSILLRMYLRFFEHQGWKSTLLHQSETTAGLKSVSLEIKGEYVYGSLKHEQGQHKLYRKSPFKANNSRQTSFVSVFVTPVLEDYEITIKPEDLDISTSRSSGAGGQKVNKTDTAIRIVHRPTGIVVECQTERSQLQNKERAMTMLRSKLFEQRRLEQEKTLKDLKGEYKKADFGSEAVRIYILDTPKKIKDYRTLHEEGDVQKVLDGHLDDFIKEEIAHFRN